MPAGPGYATLAILKAVANGYRHGIRHHRHQGRAAARCIRRSGKLEAEGYVQSNGRTRAWHGGGGPPAAAVLRAPQGGADAARQHDAGVPALDRLPSAVRSRFGAGARDGAAGDVLLRVCVRTSRHWVRSCRRGAATTGAARARRAAFPASRLSAHGLLKPMAQLRLLARCCSAAAHVLWLLAVRMEDRQLTQDLRYGLPC